MDFLLQQTLNALQWGSFYALIALGYTLVYGVLRLINFAHGDIFMVGAYISFFVATYLVSSDGLGLSKPMTLWLTIVLTMELADVANEFPKNLPYGLQRRVELARALSTDPKLLLLDEPAAGLNSSDVDGLIKHIRWIFDEFKIAIWMIEHQMKVVMMLTKCLRELEDYGLVHRQQYNAVPPRVEYSLTERGKELLPALGALYAWGRDQMEFERKARATTSDS